MVVGPGRFSCYALLSLWALGWMRNDAMRAWRLRSRDRESIFILHLHTILPPAIADGKRFTASRGSLWSVTFLPVNLSRRSRRTVTVNIPKAHQKFLSNSSFLTTSSKQREETKKKEKTKIWKFFQRNSMIISRTSKPREKKLWSEINFTGLDLSNFIFRQ